MSLSAHDLDRLRRAIALAAKGRFRVEPNPLVGCVIEREGAVVGEGWHDGYGGAHAEVRALAVAGAGASGATAYVSLEPCSRHGKTPPCTDALLQAGVARVVFAAADPDPHEGGRSAALLRAAHVEVVGPALPAEGEALLARFATALASPRPWVIAKWAMSADGRTAPQAGAGGRITGSRAEAEVHELRGRCDGVLVGHGTLASDDPLLTCRLAAGPPDGRPQPLRVVTVARLTRFEPRRLWDSVAVGRVLAACASSTPDVRRALQSRGVEVLELPGADGRVDLPALLAHLRRGGVRRLLVEGGSRLHGTLLRQGLVDQVTVWVAPLVLGGPAAVAAVDGTAVAHVEDAPRLAQARWRKVGEDLLLEGYLGGS